MVTTLELRCNTQKSRIAELEGSQEMAQENMTNIRKQSLLLQEKMGSQTKVICYSFYKFVNYLFFFLLETAK